MDFLLSFWMGRLLINKGGGMGLEGLRGDAGGDLRLCLDGDGELSY